IPTKYGFEPRVFPQAHADTTRAIREKKPAASEGPNSSQAILAPRKESDQSKSRTVRNAQCGLTTAQAHSFCVREHRMPACSSRQLAGNMHVTLPPELPGASRQAGEMNTPAACAPQTQNAAMAPKPSDLD